MSRNMPQRAPGESHPLTVQPLPSPEWDHHRDCAAGYEKSASGSSCQACVAGVSYRSAQQNAVSQGQAANTCAACGCPDGYFETGGCTQTANFQCSLCACTAGQFLPLGVCPAGTKTFNVTDELKCQKCLAVADCEPGVSYLSGLCSGAERRSNICIMCTLKWCEPGFYSGGCNGFTPPTCIAYTVCPSNQYLSGNSQTKDGVCLPCRVCPNGAVGTIVACSAYQNTVCTGEQCSPTKGCPPLNTTIRYCEYAEYEEAPTCGVCPVSLPPS